MLQVLGDPSDLNGDGYGVIQVSSRS